MAAALTQAEVERALGLKAGQATGGFAQSIINTDPQAKAKIEAAIAAKNAATAQPAPSAQPTQAGYWNEDVATALGQIFGLLQEGQKATGGFLNEKLKNAPPEVQAEFNKLALGIQQGTLSQDMLMNQLIERESKKQSTDPAYGSLAKAPYKTFTPYAEQAPEFKPFSMSDFVASPDYNFRLQEGQKALDRAGATRGNFYSGGALKEAAKFGSDLASGEYGNAYNRYNQDYATKAGQYTDAYNRYNTNFGVGYNQAASDSDRLYNRYAGLAGAGSGTANAAVNANSQNAAAGGNIYGQVANSQAAANIQNANNISQLLANSFGTSAYKKAGQ